jgi:hypothetical protein
MINYNPMKEYNPNDGSDVYNVIINDKNGEFCQSTIVGSDQLSMMMENINLNYDKSHTVNLYDVEMNFILSTHPSFSTEELKELFEYKEISDRDLNRINEIDVLGLDISTVEILHNNLKKYIDMKNYHNQKKSHINTFKRDGEHIEYQLSLTDYIQLWTEYTDETDDTDLPIWKWDLRGTKSHNYQMIRIDKDQHWTKDNTVVVRSNERNPIRSIYQQKKNDLLKDISPLSLLQQ